MKTVFQILAAVATVAVLTAPAQAQMKQSLAHMKHVIASWNDTPDQAGLLPTALEELEIAQQHAALALAKPDDLASLKLHAGHVIHALDPSVEAKGPGRGYGVVKAASGAAKHIGFAAAAADASDGVKAHAVHVSASAENVVTWAADAVALAARERAAAGPTAPAEGLYLVRSLPPWTRNAGKRLVKAAKVYWRDSGILHALAGLPTLEHVLGHPICGASWEGYSIEQILTRVPKGATASHYRTHAGAEVDLVIEQANGQIHAIEIKRTLSPKLTPGLVESMQTLGAHRGFLVIPEGDAYPLSKAVTAVGLRTFLDTPH